MLLISDEQIGNHALIVENKFVWIKQPELHVLPINQGKTFGKGIWEGEKRKKNVESRAVYLKRGMWHGIATLLMN